MGKGGCTEPAFAYAANQYDNSVSVIDPLTHQAVGQIPVDSPYGIAVDPTMRTVYVTDNGTHTFTVIDGNTNTVVTQLPLESACGTDSAPAVNTNNHLVYVPMGDGMVAVVNGRDNSLMTTVEVGGRPTAAAVSTRTNLVYIANDTNEIPVINSNTNTLYAKIPLKGESPATDVQADLCSNKIYVQRLNSSISVLGGNCNEEDDCFAPEGGVFSFSLDPSLGLLYVVDAARRVTAVYDACTLQKLGALPLPVTPCTQLSRVAVNSTTHLVYVTDSGAGAVYVVDGGANRVIGTVEDAKSPFGTAVLGCPADCPGGAECGCRNGGRAGRRVGSTAPTGAPQPLGSPALRVYGGKYYYDRTVAEEDITGTRDWFVLPLDLAMPAKNVDMAVSDSLTIQKPGVYLVNFFFNYDLTNSDDAVWPSPKDRVGFAVFCNDAPLPGPFFGADNTHTRAAGIYAQLNAGDVLNLRFRNNVVAASARFRALGASLAVQLADDYS
ncbi:MAG: YncE family protein [Oscillospiraceae bacterium]|nr:YncE family protein [Oscillospiraceae bacterium]